MRDDHYRLIWNLSYDTTFTNACTSDVTFQSMLEAASQGDPVARRVTQRYQHRPEWELYDVQADPQEQRNLYGQPELEQTVQRLQAALKQWMLRQGDRGIETEMDALNHQGSALRKSQKTRKAKRVRAVRQDQR